MFTSSPLPTPAQLATPPNIDACRPLCRCGAVPNFPYVGMHGDGLTRRIVAWPVFGDGGTWSIVWTLAVGRRFWCPVCGTTILVSHPGIRRSARYTAVAVAALLHVVTAVPLGQGLDDAHAHALARGQPLPISERARSGRTRWSTLRRWCRNLHKLWPQLPLPSGDRHVALQAVFTAFGPGAPLIEVLAAAMDAHARGGLAM